jgi:hypothetical protein
MARAISIMLIAALTLGAGGFSVKPQPSCVNVNGYAVCGEVAAALIDAGNILSSGYSIAAGFGSAQSFDAGPLVFATEIQGMNMDVTGEDAGTGTSFATKFCLPGGCESAWPGNYWSESGAVLYPTTTSNLVVAASFDAGAGTMFATDFCLPGSGPTGGCITTWPSSGTGYWSQAGNVLYPSTGANLVVGASFDGGSSYLTQLTTPTIQGTGTNSLVVFPATSINDVPIWIGGYPGGNTQYSAIWFSPSDGGAGTIAPNGSNYAFLGDYLGDTYFGTGLSTGTMYFQVYGSSVMTLSSTYVQSNQEFYAAAGLDVQADGITDTGPVVLNGALWTQNLDAGSGLIFTGSAVNASAGFGMALGSAINLDYSDNNQIKEDSSGRTEMVTAASVWTNDDFDVGVHYNSHGSTPALAVGTNYVYQPDAGTTLGSCGSAINTACSYIMGTDANGVVTIAWDGGAGAGAGINNGVILATVTLASNTFGDAGWTPTCTPNPTSGPLNSNRKTFCQSMVYGCFTASANSFEIVAVANAQLGAGTFYDGGSSAIGGCAVNYHTGGWSG